MGALLGELGGGSFAGDPVGYERKALEMGVSFHRGPLLGNMEGCSFLRAFEIMIYISRDM
jgi:hypothetical protein